VQMAKMDFFSALLRRRVDCGVFGWIRFFFAEVDTSDEIVFFSRGVESLETHVMQGALRFLTLCSCVFFCFIVRFFFTA